MPNSAEHISLNRPGPDPVFTERLVVNVRPDQLQTLNRLSSALEVSRSDLVRAILDQAVTVWDQALTDTMKEMFG